MTFAHPKYIDPNKPPAPRRPTVDTGKGLTKQANKKETDINFIMSKYQKTGLISFATKESPEYMKVPAVDFQTAMDTVIRGNEMFAEMPSQYRKQFNNDPGEFLEFVQDPANLDKMVEMGLANRFTDPGPDGVPNTPDDTEVIDTTPSQSPGDKTP